MWGTSSPDDELTGDFGNAIEATQIAGRRLVRLVAGNLSPGNFGLLQHNLPIATRTQRSKNPWLFDHLVGAEKWFLPPKRG
jgi:hypothetical protein